MDQVRLPPDSQNRARGEQIGEVVAGLDQKDCPTTTVEQVVHQIRRGDKAQPDHEPSLKPRSERAAAHCGQQERYEDSFDG